MKYAILALFLLAAGCNTTDNATNAQASTQKAGCCGDAAKAEKAGCCSEAAATAEKKECCSTEAAPAKKN